MDFSRISVVFWLTLPILVFLINRFVHWATLRVHPVITSGRITDAYTYTKDNPDGSKRIERYIGYTFNVGGIDFTGTDDPFWGTFKEGDLVKVRYNPQSPSDSELWRPGKAREWMIVAFTWLCWVLGSSFVAILIGVTFMLGGVWSIKNARAFIKQGAVGVIALIALVPFLLFMGFLIVEMGVDIFRNCGFIGQVWLWTVWNHQPACFLP